MDDAQVEIIRPNWECYFLDIAHAVAARSTCRRLMHLDGIGAVLVEHETRHILGTGFCGSPPGMPHCTDPGVGCLIDPTTGGCIRTVHAEMNALLHARSSTLPKTLYSTVSPCWACMKAALAAGVRRIVYATQYRTIDLQRKMAADADVSFTQFVRPWAPELYTGSPPGK